VASARVIHRFQVATSVTGSRRVVQVHLYDDVDDMRAATQAQLPSPHGHGGAYATCTSFGTPVPAPKHGHTVAVIRLWTGQLTVQTIAHEVSHAALHIYMMDKIRRHSRAWPHIHVANEPLAYMTGNLTSDVISRLQGAGFSVVP
jgi:hypothetical protein